MENFVDKLKTGAAGALVIGLVFFISKGLIVTVWSPPDTPTTYRVVGDDQRTLSFTFLPNRKTVAWYIDPNQQHFEVVLIKMYGTYGTHYVGGLWKLAGTNFPFGLRIVPADVEPVSMEAENLARFVRSQGSPTFPSEGSKWRPVFYLGNRRMKFQSMWFEQTPTNMAEVNKMLDIVGASE